VAPLGGSQSRGGQPSGRSQAQRTETAADFATWLVGLASAVLSDFWNLRRLAGYHGEDAASALVSHSVVLRPDGEAVAVAALGGVLRDAARGDGDPARRGAACVAWEMAGIQHCAGSPETPSVAGVSGISWVRLSMLLSK